MKNNRQIGLNGRIFVTNCLHNNAMFVFVLIAGGLLTALADILKLTGHSGALMGKFTTTLLLYDFVVSLLLVVVLFYAYFLECGDSVPILRERPLVIFGLFRLGYYILLLYYICYRALYCVTHKTQISQSLFFFYIIYGVLVFLLILANCFLYNVLTKNMIRRSYSKSFHRLATIGLIVQCILPIVYIVARILMADVGDEYFTSSMCDMLRLCICPLFSVCVWLLYIGAIGQVKGVFEEVDTALRERRYQITYTAPDQSEEGKKGKKNAVASTAFLPAPPKAETAALSGATAAAALPAAPKSKTAVSAPAPKKPAPAAAPQERKPAAPAAPVTPPVQQAAPAPQPTEFGAPAAPAQPAYPNPPVYPAAPAVPLVQEYNPYPEQTAPQPQQVRPQPVRTGQPQRTQHGGQPRKQGGAPVKRQGQPAGRNSGRPQQGGGQNAHRTGSYRGQGQQGSRQDRPGRDPRKPSR
ncbi:MAG: hypothetical protein E7559_05560 [Ruminococcaceae bacterium]|nr:hypothetical protein [Oscillospiraceae bacterium]